MGNKKGKLLSYKGKFETKKLTDLTVGDLFSAIRWWLIIMLSLSGIFIVIYLLTE